jgi:hypothetical protein
MRGQPQIIIRRQVDDSFAVEGADSRLLVIEHAQLEVRALGFEFVELVGEVRERVGAGRHEGLNFFRHGFTRMNTDKADTSLIVGLIRI